MRLSLSLKPAGPGGRGGVKSGRPAERGVARREPAHPDRPGLEAARSGDLARPLRSDREADRPDGRTDCATRPAEEGGGGRSAGLLAVHAAARAPPWACAGGAGGHLENRHGACTQSEKDKRICHTRNENTSKGAGNKSQGNTINTEETPERAQRGAKEATRKQQQCKHNCAWSNLDRADSN